MGIAHRLDKDQGLTDLRSADVSSITDADRADILAMYVPHLDRLGIDRTIAQSTVTELRHELRELEPR